MNSAVNTARDFAIGNVAGVWVELLKVSGGKLAVVSSER